MTCDHAQCKARAEQLARAEAAGDRVLAELLEMQDAVELEREPAQ